MSRENELFRNTVILSIGRFLPKLVSIITLPILTARLTKSEYGTYDLISGLVMLLMPIATLQIQSAAFRFLIDSRKDEKKTAVTITNIFILTVPVSIVVSVALIFFMHTVGSGIRILISIYFFADILYLTIAQVVRGLGQNKVYSVSSIILSCINCLGIVLTVQIIGKGLPGVMVSVCMANMIAVIFLGYHIKISRYIKLSFLSKKHLREMVSYSWPMIPNNLSNWVLRLSDRVVITAVLGIEANAVYAVANKIPNLLSIAQSVFVMAWQENASIAVKDKDADVYYTKMFDKIFSLLIGFTAILIAFTPIMFVLLIKGDYDHAYYQIPLLFLAMFFYCISAFQGGIYIAHKKTRSVGVTTIAAAIVNLAIDVLLVKVIGITAGSLSTLTAYFLLYIFRLRGTLKFQKITYNIKKQVILLAAICVMLAFCLLRNAWMDVMNIAIGFVLFFELNQDLVKSVYKQIIRNQK